jgi:Tfp pilus assembly protein PilZ
VTTGRASKRREERKFKRLFVRYGSKDPKHTAVAMQLSSGGMFLSTNDMVYAQGAAIVIEVKGPQETWIVSAIVRHAFKVHPNMARFTRPGMGVELTSLPDGCRQYLASL